MSFSLFDKQKYSIGVRNVFTVQITIQKALVDFILNELCNFFPPFRTVNIFLCIHFTLFTFFAIEIEKQF